MMTAVRIFPRLAGLSGVNGPVAEMGSVLWSVAHVGSVGLSAYHGYKRNRGSVKWAIAWGLLGGLFPIITPAVAFAQGIGDRK
jgi:hypothetical protein